MHHTCMACISIDSVMKMEKKSYPKVYLEEPKFKINQKKIPGFIEVEFESDSSSDSEWLDLSTYWGGHGHPIFSLTKTPLGETGCLSNPYFFQTGCLGIQFFDSLLFQHRQLGYPWLHTPHWRALAWLTGCLAISFVIKFLPPNPYPGKKEKHFRHVPLLTHLICFLQKGYYIVGSI